MVARGDLAIEARLEMIPAHQKKIIERANRAGKLVITATQMLESMTDNALPTRAEVTDVANAVLDGTDVLMLSGETAVGKHPVESVRQMAAIAETTEEALYPFDRPVRPAPSGAVDLARVTTRAAAQAARDAHASAVVIFTESGRMAALLSDERARAPILAFTAETSTLRRLALYWGVRPSLVAAGLTAPELVAHGEGLARAQATAGDVVVVVLGRRLAAGAHHTVQLLRVEEPAR